MANELSGRLLSKSEPANLCRGIQGCAGASAQRLPTMATDVAAFCAWAQSPLSRPLLFHSVDVKEVEKVRCVTGGRKNKGPRAKETMRECHW